MTDAKNGSRARAVAAAVEPLAAQVYFAPECHDAYQELGFAPSPKTARSVALPDGPAYFCSRGSLLGQVPGQVVAAAFAVFNPAVVVSAVTHGWTLTDAATICAARDAGAIAQLTRILGPQPEGADRAARLLERAGSELRPEGRSLYAGLLGLEPPDDPIGTVWRLADRLREYRGDAHTASWTAAGFDGVEIGLLTELYWGLALRSYVRTRAWSDADLDAAEARLTDCGLLADGALTEQGRTAREEVERATDRQCRPIVDALGDDLDELLSILSPWGAAIRQAGGYPASGPHDLAG
ncbi:MAG: hypothetical protein GEV09_03315 [Pseudonocardiaceae bacterium]|nr:hypothetical protein [Pseudonocardiaceae bacterium]